MPFSQTTLRVVSEDFDQQIIAEELQKVIDGFVLRGLPIFDSELTVITICDVEDAAEVRKDSRQS